MKYGKRHESWKKASYIWEKDICDGEGQVLLRDIRVLERGTIDGNNHDVWPKTQSYLVFERSFSGRSNIEKSLVELEIEAFLAISFFTTL